MRILSLASYSRPARTFVFGAVLAASAALVAAAPPFEINPERVKVTTFGGSLAGSKTYFIPTVTILVSASGSIWAQSKSGGANAQAHARYFVKGLEKAALQGLAKQMQDELVAKLRAAGHTVLTYDDLKANAVVSGHGRDKPDAKWGLPTTHQDPSTYVVAAPSDEQAFDRPINGPVWWLRDVAKEKDLIVLVPEITLNVPQVFGEKGGGYKRAEASISMNPSMKLHGAMVWTINGKGGTANIQVQEHGMRLVTEVAGTTTKLSEDKTQFSESWGRSSTDVMFSLDPAAFSAGVLRVGSQINDLIVAQIAKAKK